MTERSDTRRPAPHRPMSAQLRFALVAAVVALLAEVVLTQVWEISAYSILVGAVALAVWYGGVVTGLLCAALAWAGAIPALIGEHDTLGLTVRESWIQWSISLGVALGMIWVSALLRRARVRASEAAEIARESAAGLENLQRLSSALSAAASVSDVISTLVREAPAVMGAPLALGFAEDGDVVIAQPVDQTAEPWQVERLTTGRMLHRTATEGRLLRAVGREELEATFPDTAALAPNAEAAIAVPLRVEGRVIGSIGFVFARAGDVDDESDSLALVVAGLGSQAIERARLYEGEQESRRGLDRILRVAPSFFSGSESAVADTICLEARTVFGADLATLWRVQGDAMRLSAFDPAVDPLESGLETRLAEFPQLEDAVRALNISFVPDVRADARGSGLARVRALDLRSSLRVPFVSAGQAEYVLALSWQTEISSPDASTLVLLRRFADQAGLALEQVERRRAETEANQRARDARRLNEMTSALAHAATPADVSAVCLEHARAAVGASGGVLVRAPREGATLEVLARVGPQGRDLAPDLSTEANEPLARAVSLGETTWPSADNRSAAMPLRAGSRVLGVVELTFGVVPQLSEDERDRLESILSQCALALERSFLFDSEHRLRRLSERLQEMTAELSNALTRADVVDVLLSHVEEALGTECAAVALLGPGLRPAELLGWRGYDDDVAARWLEAPLDAGTPQGRALRRLAPELHQRAPDEDGDERFDPSGIGHRSFVFAPLVLGRRPMAFVVASASERLAIGDEELRFVRAMAEVAAQALDRARQFESEQTVAETLQRSVLPASLPEVSGVHLAGRYLPGTAELEVGGDWYDAIALQNGRLALVVGDVVGKGVRAAATMGQLRNAIRAFSLDRLKPSSTLARLTRLADEVIETSFATVVYADLDPETGVCRYASAGHPPPLAVSLDGRAEFLDAGRGLPLGTGVPAKQQQGVAELAHGTLLLFYTDGLIERRGEALDEGLERLRAAARSGPWDPEALVDHVLEQLVGHEAPRDDVVLLAARLLPIAPRPIELHLESGSSSLRHARAALRLWLTGTEADATTAYDIVLAAWEACANATEHGRSDAGFRMSAELVGETVRVVVGDSGVWLPPVARSERGRGLQLMQALMSSVELERLAHGTRVTLEKQLLPVAPVAPV
jgi:serine phosphatase RsbU (regulator of sigma subunit)/anti-sigma regulatory factor (Ser/Thr protein kinase)